MKRLLLISILCLPLLAGCNIDQIKGALSTTEQLSAGMQEIKAALAEATTQRAGIESVLAEIPPGPDRDMAVATSAKLDTAIRIGGAWLDKTDAAVDILKAELAQADEGFDVAEGIMRAAQPFLPAPWGAIAIGAGGLVIGLARAGWNRYLARKIVKSVDPIISQAKLADKTDIRFAQGALAGALVDEAQGDKLKLPF